MTARLTVVCAGRDNAGQPTHEPRTVADLGIEPSLGVVQLPSAQQRGNVEATRPRAVGKAGAFDLVCPACGDRVHVGGARMRKSILRAHAAGIDVVPLAALRG